MPRIALLQSDPRERARINAAIGEEHQLLTCGHWGHLRRLIRERGPDGAILDPYDKSNPVSLSALQRLRRQYPALAIIIYSDFSAREMDLYALGRMSVDGVIRAEGSQGNREIRERVTQALASSLASTVTEALRGSMSPVGLDCIRWAIEHAHLDPRVEDLAQAQGLSSRALGRELRSHGEPSPAQMLLWGRLIRAARLLNDPDRTVEAAAHHLGYSTGAALRKAFKQLAGVAPTRGAREGGVDLVVSSLEQSLGSASPES